MSTGITTVSVSSELVEAWKKKYSLSVPAFLKLSLVATLVNEEYFDSLVTYVFGLLKKDSEYNKYFGGF